MARPKKAVNKTKESAVKAEAKKMEKAVSQVTPVETEKTDTDKVIENIEKVFDSIDTTINIEMGEVVETPVMTEEETEFMNKMSEFEKSKEDFSKKIESNENIAEVLQEEIKRTEELIKESEKIIKSRTNHNLITDVWNGMIGGF